MNKSEYEYEKVPIQKCVPEKNECHPQHAYGVRHVQLIIVFVCLTANIIGRGHMGVTVVAMTSNTKETTPLINTTIHFKRKNFTDMNFGNSNMTENVENNVISRHRKVLNVSVPSLISETKFKTYDWPKSTQEMVLNGFFLGYAIMMFPMGLVSQRYGGKLPLQIALLTTTIISIFTPWLTLWGGWKAACFCRIVQGLTQAGTFPSVQALLAKWVPAEERATFTSYVYTGVTVGTVVAFQMAGLLAASRWGWPSIYYTIGVISFACFVLLTVFGYASPQDHKSISEEEKNYIMGSDSRVNTKQQKQKIPWKAIATSRPLWGTIATHIGSNISFVFFFNQVPSYIHYILGVNVKNSGLLSSLPYVASFFTSVGYGWISDYCTNKNIVSRTNARRICNSCAQCGLALCLMLTSYTSNISVAVTCLVAAMATHMGVHAGWMVNHIDLAPNFSGTLMATGNTIGTSFVVLAPIVVSYVVTDRTNVIQWRIMFFIIASISIVCNAIFVLLVSTEIQPWNYSTSNEKCIEDPDEDSKDKKENNKNGLH